MAGGTMPHFELMRSVVKEIVETFPDVPIRLRRADEIADVGSVQETFIGALHKADIVVAELSATNPNVFYELGIRFALRRHITIPMWQTGTKLPTDLLGLLGVEYNPSNPMAQREQFHKFLRSRLNGHLVDSPIYRVLPGLEIKDAQEFRALQTRVEELEKTLKQTRLDASVELTCKEAEQLLSRNDTGAALDTLKLAYNAAPNNLQVAVRYGQLLSRAERHDEAITVLESAAALAGISGGPTFIPFRELGMAYKRAGKSQLAIDWLTKAVDENPRDSDTHGIIGGVYKDAYELDRALDSYQRGFDGDPASSYCLMNVLCLLAARDKTGDKIRSKRLLADADRLTSNALSSPGANHWTMFDRAHFLLFANHEQEACELFTQAIENTKTIGELRSARKNLDLLADAGAAVSGLSNIIGLFNAADARFTNATASGQSR